MEGQESPTSKEVSMSLTKRDRKNKREELRNIPVDVDSVGAKRPMLEKYEAPVDVIMRFTGPSQEEASKRVPILDYLSNAENVVDKIEFHGNSFYRLSKKGRILFKGLIGRCYFDISMLKPKRYLYKDMEVQDDRLVLGDGSPCPFYDVPRNITSLIKHMCADKLPKDVGCLLKLMQNIRDFRTNETVIWRHPCFMDEDEVKTAYCKLRLFQNSSESVLNYLSQHVEFSTEYGGHWIDYVRRYLDSVRIEPKIKKAFLMVLNACKLEKGQEDSESDHLVGSRVKPFRYNENASELIKFIGDVFIHCLDNVTPIVDDDKEKLFRLIYMMFPEFLSNVAKDVFPMSQFQAYFG